MAMRKHKHSFVLQTARVTVRSSLWSARLWILVILWMPTGFIALGQSRLSESERNTEEVWRSSEEPGEVSTSKRKRRMKYRLPEPPPGAFRIGCICMDGTRADTRGIGSCSGHGGVRYWVYRLKDGDTVHLFTEHHLKHPEALPAEKMMELSRRRADRIRRMEESRSTSGTAPVMDTSPVITVETLPVVSEPEVYPWLEVASMAAAGVSVYAVTRLLLRWSANNPELVRYALRHLLRHRKRPQARPRRSGPRKKRLP